MTHLKKYFALCMWPLRKYGPFSYLSFEMTYLVLLINVGNFFNNFFILKFDFECDQCGTVKDVLRPISVPIAPSAPRLYLKSLSASKSTLIFTIRPYWPTTIENARMSKERHFVLRIFFAIKIHFLPTWRNLLLNRKMLTFLNYCFWNGKIHSLF